MPRYVTIDLFGKVGVGKTTIFELFAGDKLLDQGGNLSYDFRRYYARCWVLPRRWNHSMVFLADPKMEWFWRDLKAKFLRRLFEPTNILIIVSDSTKEDVLNIKKSFSIFPHLKRRLIIYIIANMQDCENRLSVEEIKAILEMEQVLGLNAKAEGAKEKVEKFLEEAAMMYFLMLSKRGEVMEILDEDEIGLNKKKKEPKPKTQSKYSHKFSSLREQRLKEEEEEKEKEIKDRNERFEKINKHKDVIKTIKEKYKSQDEEG